MKQLLSDDTITLRALDPSDLEIMLQWENNTSLWEFGNTVAPYSKMMLWEYLKEYDGDIFKTRQLRLIIERNEDKTPLGTVDFYDFDPFNSRCAIGVLIDPAFQNNGYGLRALNITVDYAKEFLGLHQCVAYIPADNIPSLRLFEKAGFNTSATLRHWQRRGNKFIDVIIMQTN